MTKLERLQEWAKLMRRIATEDLDMRGWYGCGTVACAAGHATMHAPFVEEGLVKVEDEDDTSYLADVRPGLVARGVDGETVPRWERGYLAIREFFGLSHDEATHICSKEAYKHTDKICGDLVALRIEGIIAKRTGEGTGRGAV